MTSWRALTLKQPWPWAICYAGKRVENRTWPVPPKLLNQETTVHGCTGIGVTMAEAYAAMAADKRGEPRRQAKHVDGCPGDSVTHEYSGTGYYSSTFVVPLRVMIHAGATWDDDHAIDRAWPHPMDMPHKETLDWHGNKLDQPYVSGMRQPDGLHEFQPFSAVVAVATITGSHEEHVCEFVSDLGKCSHWAQNSPCDEPNNFRPMHHWQLADVTPLANPIPAKGKLGLWKPDTELVQAVEAQL